MNDSHKEIYHKGKAIESSATKAKAATKETPAIGSIKHHILDYHPLHPKHTSIKVGVLRVEFDFFSSCHWRCDGSLDP